MARPIEHAAPYLACLPPARVARVCFENNQQRECEGDICIGVIDMIPVFGVTFRERKVRENRKRYAVGHRPEDGPQAATHCMVNSLSCKGIASIARLAEVHAA
eukprot:1556498-Pyramimonas_sp.AAC.1